MKAIRLKEPRQLVMETTQVPELQSDDDAIVRVRKIGVCGTDLHAFSGTQPFFSYPRILGHELAVEVVKTGKNVQHLKEGDFCCVEPYRNSGYSQAMRRGKTNCGEHLTVLGVHEDGGMQEFLRYPASHIHAFNQLSLDQLALIEPLAIGRHAVKRAKIRQDDTVLIVGVGPIGLTVATFAQFSGARVIVMDVNQDRLDFCSSHIDIAECVLAGANAIEELKEYLADEMPTVVIDATGNSGSMHNAFHYVAAGGTIVYVGLFQGNISFNDPLFHKKETTLKASRAAMRADFLEIGSLMERDILKADWMITHRMAFDNVVSQFATLSDPEECVVKAMIDL